MKILLSYISGQPDRQDPYISLLPSGLCYLQSTLREAGHDAVLANFSGWSQLEITRQLTTARPAVVGISQWTHNRHESMELARLARRVLPDSLILLGGGHATFRCREILAEDTPLDAVVLGEGEATLLELAERVAGGSDWRDMAGIALRRQGQVVVNATRQPLNSLDRIPFAARHLQHSIGVDRELQAEFIITARGCPSACSFCSSPTFWSRRVRFRSPENVVDEILYLRASYGLIYFSFRDDTFTADRRRTIAICRQLVERQAHIVWNCQSRVTTLDEELLVWMKRAGCECIQLGIESGSLPILALLDKSITPAQVEQAAALIKKVGIHLSVYLISDVPAETRQDQDATVSLMRRIRPDDGYVSPLAYYPGTRLFEQAVQAGRVAADVFETSREPAVYASPQPGKSSRRLLAALSGQGAAVAKNIKRVKRELGFCYVTNVTAGECYRQAGDITAAEREFREITEREPDNPWGWFLLGELYAELGEVGLAREYYGRVLRIVPQHGPSKAALKGNKKAGP